MNPSNRAPEDLPNLALTVGGWWMKSSAYQGVELGSILPFEEEGATFSIQLRYADGTIWGSVALIPDGSGRLFLQRLALPNKEVKIDVSELE